MIPINVLQNRVSDWDWIGKFTTPAVSVGLDRTYTQSLLDDKAAHLAVRVFVPNSEFVAQRLAESDSKR